MKHRTWRRKTYLAVQTHMVWRVNLPCLHRVTVYQWTSSWLCQINKQHCIFHSTFSHPSGFFFPLFSCFRLTVPIPLISSFHCYADEAQLTRLCKSKWDESHFRSLCLTDKNIGASLKWTTWLPAAITRSITPTWSRRWLLSDVVLLLLSAAISKLRGTGEKWKHQKFVGWTFSNIPEQMKESLLAELGQFVKKKKNTLLQGKFSVFLF